VGHDWDDNEFRERMVDIFADIALQAEEINRRLFEINETLKGPRLAKLALIFGAQSVSQ
jgi:hypothetical protein